MDEPLVGEAEPDLDALERIEGELFAVERLPSRSTGCVSGFAGCRALSLSLLNLHCRTVSFHV